MIALMTGKGGEPTMTHRTPRQTHAMRLLAALTLMGMALVCMPYPAAAQDPGTGPSYLFGPGCTLDRWGTYTTSGIWHTIGYGDYTPDGGQPLSFNPTRYCTGATMWTTTAPTRTAEFRWSFKLARRYSSCFIYAYIPTANAGHYHARYDFWVDGRWVAWPGKTIDQEATSGLLGLTTNPNTDAAAPITVRGGETLVVKLGNEDAQYAADGVRYVGAGDLDLVCR